MRRIKQWNMRSRDEWFWVIIIVSAIVYIFFMLNSCVAGNETATRLGTIEKNNVTISGQVEDLNLKTNNIEQQGIFAIGGGGAIWILGAFIAMLGFFSYMIRLLLHRRNLNKMLCDLTDCINHSSDDIRKSICIQMKQKSTKDKLSKFVTQRKNHAGS